MFGYERAEYAVETPRFQTEHLVSSFDNHAMKPGSLLLDERTAAGRGRRNCKKRGHMVEMQSRYDSGCGAGVDPAVSQRRDRGRRRPVLLPARRRRGRAAVRRAGRLSTATALADRLRALAAREHLHRRQLVEVRRLAGADLLAASGTCRAADFRSRLFEAECLREYAETFPTVCGDFAFYQFPTEEFWRALFAQAPAEFPLRLQSAGTDHLQGVSARTRATGRRRARRTRRSWTPACCRKCSCVRCWPYREKTAVLIFEFGTFGRRSFAEAGEFLDRLDPFLAALPPRIPLRGGDPQSGISGEGLLRLPAQPRAWRTCTMRGRGCRNCGGRWRFRIRRRRISWCAARCCAADGRTRTR